MQPQIINDKELRVKTYDEWSKIFASQDLYEFNLCESGILWLKIKSLIRSEILDFMQQKLEFKFTSKTQAQKFREIYNLVLNGKITHKQIDFVLLQYNDDEIRKIEQDFSVIESELYKINYFAWGGDSSNSLDKQIVSFVKDIYKYDEILHKIDNDIAQNVKNYTISSWYNNWSAVLTEHIFKSHPKVISAVGKIKSVDFFIENIPIDLKITYFPKEFLKLQRKANGLQNELSLLKNIAKKFAFNFDKECKDEIIKYQITQQILDSNNAEAILQLENLKKENAEIIQATIANKHTLIKWLYENQGEMRFGAENRIFLVLIDLDDFTQAWKLKRNFTLIKPQILEYLDNFRREIFLKNIVEFEFNQKQYKALADIIFVVKQ